MLGTKLLIFPSRTVSIILIINFKVSEIRENLFKHMFNHVHCPLAEIKKKHQNCSAKTAL